MTNKLSDNWIFQNLQRTNVINWINDLKYFYFIRAIGGHANDGDAFICELKSNTEYELKSMLKKIGIKNTGHQLIENNKCYVSIKERKLEFSVFGGNGNMYEISNEDYKTCKQLECLFDEYDLWKYKNSDIENQINCISKKNYPELYENL